MDRDLANRLSCVVCGIETKRHAGWFLVMENCWLDRVTSPGIPCWREREECGASVANSI